MEGDITRRSFLRSAGLALAGSLVAVQLFGQEQEKKKDEKVEGKKGEEKKPESTNGKEKKPDATDDDWDSAWKQSGSEETRTCPQCGASMYRQGRTWTCDNCGYSYVE